MVLCVCWYVHAVISVLSCVWSCVSSNTTPRPSNTPPPSTPPHQVIDTVELFHIKHQRNLRLRFLAAHLLSIDIQADSHDSIEDARTALRLFRVYQQLVKEGTLSETLRQLYKHGNMHGWAGEAAGMIGEKQGGEKQGEEGGGVV